MKNTKEFYKLISYDGFTWAYWDDEQGLHVFQKKGFHVFYATDSDILNGNFEWLIDRKLSKIFDITRKFSVVYNNCYHGKSLREWTYKTAIKKRDALREQGFNAYIEQQ